MARPNLYRVTPFLRVPDIEAAVAFFVSARSSRNSHDEARGYFGTKSGGRRPL